MHLQHPILFPVSVPVIPDDDEARQSLRDELAKGIYREAEPSVLERAWRAVLDWLVELLSRIQGVDAGLGTILLGVGAVVVIVVAVLLIRPRLNARRRPEPTVFQPTGRNTSQAHRERANLLADQGNWDSALAERFRAITRAAEERVVLDEQAGRTALEVADQLRRRFAGLAQELDWLASRFNEVHYGARPATPGDYARCVALDAELERAQPMHGPGAERWAAPV